MWAYVVRDDIRKVNQTACFVRPLCQQEFRARL
jgi:hypothetical protein